MEFDEDRARARPGEIEMLARSERAGEGGGGVADVHDEMRTAMVTPSRSGTRVVTKSWAA